MSLPTLTPEARDAALAKAVAARKERAAALAELKNGTITLAEFLTSDNEVLKRTKVKQVIQALPGVGKVRAGRLLEQAKVDPLRRVGGLGPVQRATLEDLLAA